MKTCPCGSGLPRDTMTDAAAIFLCYVCDQCEAEKLKRYDPAIFDQNSRYAVTGEEEDIRSDD